MTIVNPLSAEERRVIGCLIEKGATTPDNYPLTTNSLKLACNQSTSRDPIVDYSEREVDAVMLELRQRGLARTVSGSGHRVGKHRHIVDEALSLSGPELGVLAVLLLRGPQTVAALVSRTARYADGPENAEGVESAIDSLSARDEPLVRRLGTRPGEREPRVEQIWSPVGDSAEADLQQVTSQPSPNRELSLNARVAALEAALAEQTARLDALVAALGEPDVNSAEAPEPPSTDPPPFTPV